MRSVITAIFAVKRLFEGIRRRLRQWVFRRILGTLGPGAIIDRDVTLFNPENIFIGNNVSINREVVLQGSETAGITIGNSCTLSYRTMLLTAGLQIPFTEADRQHSYKDIVIGDNVWLCAGVIVLPGSVIEDNVVVAAGAVVSGHLESGWYYGGVPAKPLKPIPASGERHTAETNGNMGR